jgi:hypothetical protein
LIKLQFFGHQIQAVEDVLINSINLFNLIDPINYPNLQITPPNPTFTPLLVHPAVHRRMIKREPGGNPGLSRSCKLRNRSSFIATVPLTSGWEGRAEGSKSEDLPKHRTIHSFRGMRLE